LEDGWWLIWEFEEWAMSSCGNGLPEQALEDAGQIFLMFLLSYLF
jgi:hypothetical protein